MEKRAFDFVKINELSSKPRRTGIIEIRGPLYYSVTVNQLKGLLEDWSDYFDGYKFAGGSQRLLPEREVRETIKLCHDYGIYVSTGGFIERVIIQGHKAVDQYLEECKALDFDVVEVSSGFARIPIEEKVDIVKQVIKLGMKPKPELTMMVGAGGGTHIVGYEQQMKMRNIKDFFKEAEMHIKAGAKMMMFESEGVTEDLPPNKWRKDIIKKAVEKFGYEKWMFEAADPEVFKWYIKTFGKDVNLFIDNSQIVELSVWRLGVWGDKDIWNKYNHDKKY